MIRWVAFVSVGVDVGASQRIPLSVLVREFVSVNFALEIIVREDLLSLQMLFLHI